MRPLSFLLLWLPLILASSSSSDDSTDTVIERTFPLVETPSAAYSFNEEAPFLPDDLWIKISENLDGASLWNMSLVNKHLGALLRGSQGFQRILSEATEYEVLDVLEASELKIYWYHLDLFRNSVGWMTNWAVKQPDSSRSLFSMIEKLTERLQEKAGDWKTFYYFLTTFSGTSEVSPALLDPTIINDIWECIHELPRESLTHAYISRRKFYLPDPSAQKLFDKIDPKLVVRFAFSRRNMYTSMFLPSLLCDYLLPSFRGEFQVIPYENECIRLIFKKCSGWFKPYFARLAWALRLQYGLEFESKMGPICEFLEDFGFNPKQIMPIPLIDKLNSLEIKFIYAVAIQWGLDTTNINSGIQLTESDMTEITQMSLLNAKNMRNLMAANSSNDSSKMRKMHLVDGELVSEADSRYQKYLKRKRDEEDGTDDQEIKRPRLIQ